MPIGEKLLMALLQSSIILIAFFRASSFKQVPNKCSSTFLKNCNAYDLIITNNFEEDVLDLIYLIENKSSEPASIIF